MTREEFSQIATALKAIYADPKFMADRLAMEVWYKVFQRYDYSVIADAASSYIENDDFGKAPVPGQIIACIKTEVGGLLEADAWDLVTKAISNSIYNSDEEYAKLPVECQKAVGSANNLRQLAIVDIDTLQTVEKSTFMSRYRAVVSSLKKEQQRPEYIKDRLETKAVREIETRSM